MSNGQFGAGFLSQQLAEGKEFRTGTYQTNLNQGDTVRVTIENPQGSGKTFFLSPLKATSTASVEVTPGFVDTVDSEGTQLDKIQLNGESNVASVATVRRGDTVTLAQEFPTEFLPSGAAGGSQLGSARDGQSSAAMIQPGGIATSGFTLLGSGRISVVFNWVEIEQRVVPAFERNNS